MLRKALMGFVVAAVVLGATEGVLRVTLHGAVTATIDDVAVRNHVGSNRTMYDPYLGWKRDPRNIEPEFNKAGFRYPTEITTERPAGTHRGVTLGDSQTYGAGVTSGESYTAVAEASLRARGFSVELLNAGLSGYTSLQALRLISSELLAYDPDILVIDCRTNDSSVDEQVPTWSPWMVPVQRVLFDSRIYYLMQQGWSRVRPDAPRPMRANSTGRTPGGPAGGNHLRIAQLARARNITVVFLDYPFMDTTKQPVTITQLAPPSELPAGAAVTLATDALRSSGLTPPELFLDNNHLSIKGNEVVGAALADTLAEVLAP